MKRLKAYRKALIALGALVLCGLVSPQVLVAQACEAGCNQACNARPAAEKKNCKFACFAGRCANPGALNVAEASGEPGISCEVDGACNAFCQDGPVADSDCALFAFPPGHVGYVVEIYLNGVKQSFTAAQLVTNDDGSATQNGSGAVLLSVSPCNDDRDCTRLAAVRALVGGPSPAGTAINFNVLHVSGLPAANTQTHCVIERQLTFTNIPGSELDPSTSLGNNFFALNVAEPGGIVLHCEITSGSK